MQSKVDSNFLKGLAIIAVVAIHSFSKTINSPISLFVDQLSRYTVPLFMALSGFGLAMSFQKNGSLINFYLKRVWKVLPWFIVASLVIMIFRNWFENAGFDLLNYHTWTSAIFRGGADYHLYFVPTILKFYLIFPLLFLITRKFPRLTLGIALIWQIYWYTRITTGTEIVGNYNQVWPDQMQYLDPKTWIFYFVFGIFLSLKSIPINRYFITAVLISGYLLSFINAFLLQRGGIDSLVATRFTRLPVLLYATSFILFFFNFPFGSSKLAILGKYSFQIYLFHTITLRLLPQVSGFILTPAVLILTLIPFMTLTRLKEKLYKKSDVHS